MVSAKPRLAGANTGDVFFLFTDASFDSEAKTGGLGVLLDQAGTVVAWFGGEVDSSFCASFMAEEQEQAIGELEAFAVSVALHLWCEHVKSRHLVCFLEYEGSRFLILKGYPSNPTLTRLCMRFLFLRKRFVFWHWYARIPTEANLSDLPSRGLCSELLPEGSRTHVESFQKILDSARELGGVSPS